MPSPLRIGVVGLGTMGQIHAFHVANHVKNARLGAICDQDASQLEVATAQLGVPGCTDASEFTRRADLDAIVIATPPSTHPILVEAAITAGKHVFCEKPVSLTLAGIESLRRILHNSRLQFQVGFQRRWDPDYVLARKNIESGAVGKPLLFKSHGRDAFTEDMETMDIQVRGDIFIDAAVHDFDIARYFFGEPITHVYARAANLGHPRVAAGIFDTCIGILEFSSGALGVFEWSRCGRQNYETHVEIVGSSGTIRISSAVRSDMTLGQGQEPVQEAYRDFTERFRTAYATEIQGFVDAIRSGRPTSPNINDAYNAVALAEAARKSAERGHRVSLNDNAT